MPLPVRYNPSYSSTGVNRKSILSATPQQKLSSNFNAMSCNSKFAMSCNSKFVLASERKHIPDTRNLSDASYHHACFDQILKFCSKNNYQLQRNQLNFLSKGEMERLFSFILSFYDIKIKQGCLETEIPKVMESLCYPYHINKTAFSSYAMQKTKGVILSIFIYLIEPLMIEKTSIFSNKDADPNLEILEVVLSRNQEEKDKFIKKRMDEQLAKKKELEALIKKREELENESRSLDNPKGLLKKLRDEVNERENNLKLLKDYEEKMKNWVESLLKDKEESKANLDAIEVEIEKLKARKLELELKIKEQPHSVDEMKYYVQRDKQVQIEIIKLDEELKKVRQEFYAEKLRQDGLFDSLKECFFKLTGILRTFKSDLSTAQHLNECLENEQFRALIVFINNPDFDAKEPTFSLELYGDFLKSLKQAMNKDLLVCKEEICKFQNVLEASLTRIRQLEQKNHDMTGEKQNEIQKLDRKKLDLIEQIKNKKDENEGLEAELHAIDADLKLKVRMAMNERMEAQNRCEEAKKEFYDHWLSIKQKTIHLENQLKSMRPLCAQFEKERELTRQLNQKLGEQLEEERKCVEALKV